MKKKDKKIQKLKEELKENEEYFNDNEESRIKKQEEISELNKKNNELNKENLEIKKESNNKNELIDEYKNELYILGIEHKQKIQEIEKELSDKGISLNKLNGLNNEYEKKYKN